MSRLLILCLLLLITGCAGSMCLIQTRYDEFEGYTVVRMVNNDLGGRGLYLDTGFVYLNVQKLVSKEGRVSYCLIAEYTDFSDCASWLFIESGESLVLLVDGKRVGLTGDGSWNNRNVLYGGSISETAWYPINPEIIRMISNAKEVKVKLIGSNSFVQRYFTQTNFNNFRKFVESYLPRA